MWLPVPVANDNPKVAHRLQHFPELRLIQNADAELLRLLELAAGFLSRQDVARFFAHAAADLSAAGADQFGNFVARLAQRAGSDPRRVFKSGRGAHDFWFGFKTQSGLPQFLDDCLVVRFAKEFMNAATDDFAHVGDLLQFFYGTGRDRVEVREVVRQRPRSADADMQNSQAKQEPPERTRFTSLDRVDQIRDAFFTH